MAANSSEKSDAGEAPASDWEENPDLKSWLLELTADYTVIAGILTSFSIWMKKPLACSRAARQDASSHSGIDFHTNSCAHRIPLDSPAVRAAAPVSISAPSISTRAM